MSGVDVLANALFEAYSRNSGNPPDAHFDRGAAEHWMAQALEGCGVAELIEAVRRGVEVMERVDDAAACGNAQRLRAALARVTGAQG